MKKMREKLALILVAMLVFGYVSASAEGLTGYMVKYLAEYLKHRRALIDIEGTETPLSSFDAESAGLDSESDAQDGAQQYHEELSLEKLMPQESDPGTFLDGKAPDDDEPADEKPSDELPDETLKPGTPSVRAECIVDSDAPVKNEFILKATLVGFGDKQTEIQWQYKTKNEKEWHDATDVENGARSLQYRVKASMGNLRMMWRVLVTVVE